MTVGELIRHLRAIAIEHPELDVSSYDVVLQGHGCFANQSLEYVRTKEIARQVVLESSRL